MAQTSSGFSSTDVGEERKKLISLAMNARWAQENADDLMDKLEREVRPLVAKVKAGCGNTGWSTISRVNEDASVDVKHDCFDEHHDDRHEFYYYTVAL